MTEEKAKGQTPNYAGTATFTKDGIEMSVRTAVWVNKDKNGNPYLSLNFGGIKSNLFKFEIKPKEESAETDMSNLI